MAIGPRTIGQVGARNSPKTLPNAAGFSLKDGNIGPNPAPQRGGAGRRRIEDRVALTEMSGAERVIALADPAATAGLGQALGVQVRAGDVIFLQGELGAGKTTLARGLIEAVAGVTDIPSPTYNIVQIYECPGYDVWHVDLYRLKAAEEAFELGLDEAFRSSVCLVEWPERLQGVLGAPGLQVQLKPDGAGGRTAILRAGPEWEDRIVAI